MQREERKKKLRQLQPGCNKKNWREGTEREERERAGEVGMDEVKTGMKVKGDEEVDSVTPTGWEHLLVESYPRQCPPSTPPALLSA
mmetsp:Transcript_12783/g.33831  ORF Transcript_12783/g.33831 Transcript_12783/m.33831 type:complete len:86 (+) Transcript_12783:334-591(+)